MLIIDAIDAADKLSPNHFTLDEKLMWCSEVTAAIRREVKKQYATVETVITCADEIEIPDDILLSDIEMVYIGGIPIQKSDFRSLPFLNNGELVRNFGINLTTPKILRLVYLDIPREIKIVSVKGKFNTDSDCIFGYELPFNESDCILCAKLDDIEDEPDWETAVKTYVMSNDGEKILLTNDILTPETEACIALKRVIDDETEAEPPYDRMYIEYILAKGALYQHDYDSYAAHMTQYNNLFDEFKRDYKTRNPLTDMAGFRNYW